MSMMKPLVMALGLAVATAPLTAQTRSPALARATPVTLNFVNADIEAVTRAMSNLIGQPIVVDPRVKGQITLYAEQPMKAADAYAQYLAALRGLGFSVVNAAGLLKVVPEADAKLQATGVLLEGEKARGDQILTQVFQLRHENANNLVAVLRPLVNVNNTINANPGNNTLVITDYADNLQRIAKIIAALDTPAATELEVVPLQHQVASELAPLVQRLEGAGAGAVAGQPIVGLGGSVTVLADPRGNALILRAPNPARLAALKRLVQQLDVPSSSGGASGGIRVVHLKNADATKLAQVLRAAFAAQTTAASSAAGGSGIGSGAISLSGSGAANAPTSTQSGGAAGSSSGMQSAAASQPVNQGSGPSTGGNVQADTSTNSLVITAPDPLYRQMRAVIDQLDTRRAQVYVEAIVVKVDASQGGQFGVQWQSIFNGGKGSNTITGGGTNFGTGNANIVNLTAATVQGANGVATAVADGVSAGLNLGLLRKFGQYYTLGALANFLETQTGANVLSTPNLVVMDNEEAKIVVGQNVPFVTGSYAQGSSGNNVNPFTTVTRQDVGLVLRVKTQIGEGGAVRMTITQENSNVVPGTNSGTGPITDKNEIQTTVAVDDGGLLVLGGLMRDEYSDGDDAVPLLSKIPLVGNLFKSASRTRKKTNLMVFLRPTVLRSADEAAGLSVDRYEQIRAVQQGVQPDKNVVLPDTGAPVLPERKDGGKQ